MRLRDSLALHLAPFLIRLALAVYFGWAGASKLFYSNEYSGTAAATLANMGIVHLPGAPASPPEVDTPDSPREPQPGDLVPPSQPTPDPGQVRGESAGAWVTVQAGGDTWSAEDFIEPVKARRLHTVTLMLKRAATKGQWPAFLSSNRALEVTAWTICAIEFVGGVLLLVGFFTRVGAFALTVVAAGSLAFTVILPAIGAPDAFLWVLPDPRLAEPGAWVDAWSPWLLRLFAVTGAAAVMLMGAGKLSLDAVVFPSTGSSGGGRKPSDDDDDE